MSKILTRTQLMNSSKIDSKVYPRDLEKNLKWRMKVEQECMKSQKALQYCLTLCKEDISFFFNFALWTYDPRSEDKYLPFLTYDFQDETLEFLGSNYKNNNDALIEKSRDMGASWMVLGFILHKWLFEDGFSALIGSYIENLVDDKDNLDTHFGRLEMMINGLPPFLKPKGYKAKDHRSYMKLINPDNKNMIVGAAPTERFSRQGRYSLIWGDEFAFWTRGRSAWTSMGDATKTRIVSSTPNGKGNKYAELALKSKINKITLHWRMHPLKDAKWYEKECERRTPEEIAQELDISYNKSTSNRVYPEFGERNYSEKQEYDSTQPLFVSWDFGLKDETAIIWLQQDKKANTVRIIDAYQNSGKLIDFYVSLITGEYLSGHEYAETERRLIDKHRGWKPAIHFGDPTGNNKNQVSGKSVIQVLAQHGININVNYKKFKIKDRVHSTKLLIRRLLVDKDLEEFIDAMEGSRYPERPEGSQSVTPVTKPIHDWTSHFRTALEFYAVNEKVKNPRQATVLQRTVDNSIEERLKYIRAKHRSVGRSKNRSANYRTAC